MRLEVLGAGSCARSGEFLLLSSEGLTPGAGRAFFGFGALTVGFKVADLGEISGLRCLAPTRGDIRGLASLRRGRDERSKNQHDCNDPDNDGDVHGFTYAHSGDIETNISEVSCEIQP
jgi:hypothetical protein